MANPLVECVPNFSEGRRAEVIEAIVASIKSAGAVRILDISSDNDHNRTVVTFVGAPEAVETAAFAGIKTAAQLIDLNAHRGEHPRIGATDVVPFIPIANVTLEACVTLAKRLGQRVADELNIPVYLYETAASRPDRENLENIRRGEYEGLREAIRTDPTRMPDYGPAELGKAGATVIGARPSLIAFNAYLTTDNVEIAKKIAKVIRFSNGGLRYVKALGLLVDGKAQVSMNLTNFEKTPIYRAIEMVRREAQRYGVSIAFTELIGLAPEAALIDAARWYLQLDAFQPDQLLERRLESIPEPGPQVPEPPIPEGATTLTATVDMQPFVDKVAAGTAAPGGGAVAALAGALAAALAEMVARLTIGRKKYAPVESQMITTVEAAQNLRHKLMGAVDADSRAYTAVMDAYKLDKADERREEAIQIGLYGAIQVPLEVMRDALEAIGVARTVAELGNVNAASDAAVAIHMAMAAVESAALNVRVNTNSLTDQALAANVRASVKELIEQAHVMSADAISIAETRAGLKQ